MRHSKGRLLKRVSEHILRIDLLGSWRVRTINGINSISVGLAGALTLLYSGEHYEPDSSAEKDLRTNY